MNDLSKAERFKKCLNCGSEEHRAADCKATRRKDLTQQEPKSKPQVAQVSPPASSALPIVAYVHGFLHSTGHSSSEAD